MIGGEPVERTMRNRLDRRPSVQGHSERVDDTPEKSIADADAQRFSGQKGRRTGVRALWLSRMAPMRSRPGWNTRPRLPSSKSSTSSIAAEGNPSIGATPSPTGNDPALLADS